MDEKTITMDDLVSRGHLTQPHRDHYQITSDQLLQQGRTSITIGSPVGGDKRRFNLKWLYDYPWLQFDPQKNSMHCQVCREGRRANQFAKRGSKNFKTSALVDHATSNDHKKSLAQLSEPLKSSEASLIVLQGGVWTLVNEPLAQTCSYSTSGSSRLTTPLGEGKMKPPVEYPRQFECAVRALLQAMNLNLPISAVIDLYRLQIQPAPLSDIGSSGHAERLRTGIWHADTVPLAGSYQNSTDAARTLQHVVSSEILSMIKDEVSQSPAFSVIIDEAPLREHNSLVAHALLYLRYLRRDPESDHLQVVTRFWRCVHLYHESQSGTLAKRDPASLAITLLERAKIETSRLVCISCERPASREDEESERQRSHVIHWHGIFTHRHSLSPQVYEEITKRSDDFVRFSMALMDLCRFMYSYPAHFAFLGVEFQEALYKTLYEIFLGEGTLCTRLPMSLTPAIVIALTRNISQIMATVAALSKVPQEGNGEPTGVNIPDGGDTAQPKPSLQIPLPMVDILVSSLGNGLERKSVGRCPPADALFDRLRDYSFLGCLHFMADILTHIQPVIEIAGKADMPTRAFAPESADSLDRRLRQYVGTIKDAIETVTLTYGDEQTGSNMCEDDGGEYHGVHLNEFMNLANTQGGKCRFRTFQVINYKETSTQSLIELIRTVSSAILRDLHKRFSSEDIEALQALSDLWDPAKFPKDHPGQVAEYGKQQVQLLAHRLSRQRQELALIDGEKTVSEWAQFKQQVREQGGDRQMAFRDTLYPDGALAPSGRRLRSMASDDSSSYSTGTTAWPQFGNLAKLSTAWNVLPLALSTDLHLFRRFYERQLLRICREQAENKLQSINFDIGDTFSELIQRLTPPQHGKGRKVTVYDLLQNSKVQTTDMGGHDKPVTELGVAGVTVEYFVRSIDAVTLALDHRLRLLSLEFTETPMSTKVEGKYPKWLHNAMRGYWKLACKRPGETRLRKHPVAATGNPVLRPVSAMSQGSMQRSEDDLLIGSGPITTTATLPLLEALLAEPSPTTQHPRPDQMQPDPKRFRQQPLFGAPTEINGYEMAFSTQALAASLSANQMPFVTQQQMLPLPPSQPIQFSPMNYRPPPPPQQPYAYYQPPGVPSNAYGFIPPKQ